MLRGGCAGSLCTTSRACALVLLLADLVLHGCAAQFSSILPSINADQVLQLDKLASRERSYDCSDLESADWLRNYTLLQARKRSLNSSMYVLYVCGKAMKDVPTMKNCKGLGDRMRGMFEAVRIAQYLDRVVLFDWGDDLPLEEFFEPNSIDWRNTDDLKLYNEKSFADYSKWPINYVPPNLKRGAIEQKFNSTRVIVMSTNHYEKSQDKSAQIPGPPLGGSLISEERSCLFNQLFKPVQAVEEGIEEAQKDLFGSVDAPFVAVHLRLGGLLAETETVVRFDQIKGLMGALVCARDLARMRNISAPVLLLTDNNLLREMVAAGFFEGVVGPEAKAGHLTHHDQSDKETHLNTFVEMGLLARADCFISSPSGFSYVSRLWGNHACHLTVDECLNAYSIDNSGRHCTTLG